MTKTTVELNEKLKDLDEITLIEVLGVNSEAIVIAFQDLIDKDFNRLCKYVDWDEYFDE